MPSPVIPRSKSVPDIAIASPDSPSDILASSKSVRTTRSTGSPIISWPKKFGDIFKGKTNSDLTEKGLEEFNRRNALIEERYVTSSPYYRGLTNFSLPVHKEKLSGTGTSPGRDSLAGSYVSSGSKQSLAVRMGWRSTWFGPKKHERSYSSSSSSWTKSSHDTRFMTSSASSVSRVTENGVAVTRMTARMVKNESEFELKRVAVHGVKSTEGTILSSTMEKPLRERDSEPSAVFLQPLTAPSTPLCNETPTPLPAVQALQQEVLAAAGGDEYEKRVVKSLENERRYVWADKYRPLQLEDFLCNSSTALWLQSLARGWRDRAEDCGHFIFEGSPGVGKRTMLWALLREIFGKDKVQARKLCRKFYLKGESVDSILVNLTASQHHVEVNLSELKGYEKHVIVDLIKGKTPAPDPTTSYFIEEKNCKAVILYEADKLSIDALSYIKWVLDKSEDCNKVFFCCSDAKKLQVMRPICTSVQLLEPSVKEILEVLGKIAREEKIELPQQLANKIAINSKNNLRQAIRSFEATWHFSGCSAALKEDQLIKTGWEDKIANIAKNVVEEQSPMQLYYIRGEIKNLIEHNVAPEYIFQTLKEELEKILPEQLQMQFAQLHEEYNENSREKKCMLSGELEEGLSERQHDQKKNVQKFMRIEEFTARFMSWYKGSSTKNIEV